jgi:hypothetical protein
MSRRDFFNKFGATLPIAAAAVVGLPRVARADDLPTFEASLGNSTDDTKGAALVGFLQNGVGATGRTVFSKLADVVSVKDFGAVGNGTVRTAW